MKFIKNENILKGFFRYIIFGFVVSFFKVSDVSKMSWHEVLISMYLNFTFCLISGIFFGLFYWYWVFIKIVIPKISRGLKNVFQHKKVKK